MTYISPFTEARAKALETAAAILLSEEVEYALGLHDDHLQVTETETLQDSKGRLHEVTIEIPLPVAERRLALAIAEHRAEASVLLVLARDLRETNCGEGPLLWRDEDLAMADKTVPNTCVRERGHEGPHSGRTEEQVTAVGAYLDLAATERRHA